MAISLDGLASGLDTAALISKLMAVESAPQKLLSARVTGTQSKLTDLQSLNGKIAALAGLAKDAKTPAALTAFSAASSSAAATAKAGASATAGSVDLVVRALAQPHTIVTGTMTAWPDTPPVLTFEAADGTRTAVNAKSSSLDDMVSAINASSAGVSATKVAAGVDGSGTPQYRLQLSSTGTGAAAAFTAFRGSTTNAAANLLAEPGAATVRTAQNAEVVLWSGTPAEQVVSSAGNTFSGILGGVDVTVTALSPDPVTITVTRDTSVITSKATELVAALKAIFGTIDAKSMSSMTTDADGHSSSKLGAFTGDPVVRAARLALASAVSMPVGGSSPSQIGLSFSKDGVLELDADKLAAAVAADPTAAESMLAAIAGRIESAAASISDKYTGTLTGSITGQESLVKSLNEQIETWTTRLETRKATLERTYSALEVRMSALNSQSAWLSSQVANLPSYNGSKK